jgi:hypothetical protein
MSDPKRYTKEGFTKYVKPNNFKEWKGASRISTNTPMVFINRKTGVANFNYAAGELFDFDDDVTRFFQLLYDGKGRIAFRLANGKSKEGVRSATKNHNKGVRISLLSFLKDIKHKNKMGKHFYVHPLDDMVVVDLNNQACKKENKK